MEDADIIALYWERKESAIAETAHKYGSYCRTIADNILHSPEDAEECVNDTWMRAWNAIPPARPARLRLFLAKITRNLAFDRYKHRMAEKRGGGEFSAVLEELAECTADTADVESELKSRALRNAIAAFTEALPQRERRIFIGRYFYAKSVAQIAEELELRENHVSVLLTRIRRKLRTHLEEEGFGL